MHTNCTIFLCSNPAEPRPIASFALDGNFDGHFAYGRTYLADPDAFAIDPLHLPLESGQMIIRRHPDDSYGVLSDAGPNTWGMKLTSSLLRRKHKPLPSTPVDWLLQSWHYGSGCLGFSPSHNIKPYTGIRAEPVTSLNRKLLDLINQLTKQPDTELDEEAVRLLHPGASLGGVRPKTVVIHEGVEHIAKFSRLDDIFDVPLAEYATMRLAHKAGIRVPNFELIDIGGRSVLLIERFDRTPAGGRLHYLSAKTLLNIEKLSGDGNEYKTRYSYAGIAEAMRPIGDEGVNNSHEIFRRMVFNILVGNVDDHLRNHAFLMTRPGRFILSPAFDIVPHLESITSPQSIGVGAYGRASTIENALSQCGRFLLTRNEALEIIHQVRQTLQGWQQEFREAGMSKTDIHTLSRCFQMANEAESTQVKIGYMEPDSGVESNSLK